LFPSQQSPVYLQLQPLRVRRDLFPAVSPLSQNMFFSRNNREDLQNENWWDDDTADELNRHLDEYEG